MVQHPKAVIHESTTTRVRWSFIDNPNHIYQCFLNPFYGKQPEPEKERQERHQREFYQHVENILHHPKGCFLPELPFGTPISLKNDYLHRHRGEPKEKDYSFSSWDYNPQFLGQWCVYVFRIDEGGRTSYRRSALSQIVEIDGLPFMEPVEAK